MAPPKRWRTLLVCAALVACGHDDDDDDDTAGDETADPGEAGAAGPMPLRRLNQVEFNNTVRDLLGDDSRPADSFTPDVLGPSGFALAPVVTEVPARDLMRVSESLAKTAAADLGALLPCDIGSDELGCVRTFVGEFGRRAFRRPISDDEVSELVDIFKQARGQLKLEVADSIAVLLQVILLSPRFVYRWELGTVTPEVADDGAVDLNDHELASRLSYFLWATMPDDDLFAAADAGSLRDPDMLATQVRRMLADPRARDAVVSFHSQWLGLANFRNAEIDGSQFPTIGADAIKTSMLAQFAAFVNHVVFEAEGGLGMLLTADFTFADMNLGNAIYFKFGLGQDMAKLDLDPAQPRAGVLSLPIFLSKHSFFRATSPVKRGKVIRERLLCNTLPPPPPNANNIPPMADPSETTRGLYDLILANKDCVSCHNLMNPLGYAFENLDPLGRWRPTEFGHPIDPSGWISGIVGEPEFADAKELAGKLADLAEVQSCYGKQWLRYALQRLEVGADEASLTDIYGQFEEAGFDIQELIVAVALSPAFRTRLIAEGEMP